MCCERGFKLSPCHRRYSIAVVCPCIWSRIVSYRTVSRVTSSRPRRPFGVSRASRLGIRASVRIRVWLLFDYSDHTNATISLWTYLSYKDIPSCLAYYVQVNAARGRGRRFLSSRSCRGQSWRTSCIPRIVSYRVVWSR